MGKWGMSDDTALAVGTQGWSGLPVNLRLKGVSEINE